MPAVKLVGAFLLWGGFCFAAGNSHMTEAAMKGQAAYFQKHEKQHVLVQKKLDIKLVEKVKAETRHEDAKAVGVPDHVLKSAVEATKSQP
jgi:hypothetical protein